MKASSTNILISLYLLTLSFTDVFSLTSWIKLPFIFLFASALITLTKLSESKKILKNPFNTEDIFIILGVGSIVFSSALNPSSHSLNYIVGYSFIFFFCYLFFKVIIENYSKKESLLKANYYGVILVSIYVLTSFISHIAFGINIDNFFDRSRDAQATFLGIKRSYGFATEPTILALYYNTLGVLAIWSRLYNENKRSLAKSVITISLIFTAWFTTFSGAGIPLLIASLISMLIVAFFSKRRKALKLKYALGILSILPLLILLSFSQPVYYLITGLFSKISLDPSTASSRLGRWSRDIDRFLQSPLIGHGPGSYSAEGLGSSTNWYLFMGVEAGIFAPLFFGFFILFSIIRTLTSNIPGKHLLAAGMLAGGAHFLAISSFFHPFLWTLIALTSMIAHSCSQNNDFSYQNVHPQTYPIRDS